MPTEGEVIFYFVEVELYEKALGITLKATRQEINSAHLRLSHKFHDSPEIRDALSKAKAVLVGENEKDKGRRLSKIGKNEEALPYLKKAVKLRGEGLDYHWLGTTLSNLNRNKKALPLLKKAVKLRGEGLDYHWLGAILCELDRKEKALPHLEKAVKLRGEGLDYHWLGTTLCELDRKEKALPHLEKAVKLRGDGLDYHWLGATYSRLGRNYEALPHLKKAVELRGDKNDHEWFEHVKKKNAETAAKDFLEKKSFLHGLSPEMLETLEPELLKRFKEMQYEGLIPRQNPTLDPFLERKSLYPFLNYEPPSLWLTLVVVILEFVLNYWFWLLIAAFVIGLILVGRGCISFP